ncbi:MAG: TetR/AcrR family transcriptional regulator [Actinomycetota bacterium]
MVRRSDTRRKMVATAASLFQRQGYAATGWRQVVAESDTPWGSQSHHFPGGKEELAVEALTAAGADYERLVRQAFVDRHPADAIRLWTDLAGQVLEATDWADGCPIATVTLERAHEGGAIGGTCHHVFESWRRAIVEGLAAVEVDPARAQRLATLLLASIEGGLLLARAARSRRPLDDLGHELGDLLDTEIPRTA